MPRFLYITLFPFTITIPIILPIYFFISTHNYLFGYILAIFPHFVSNRLYYTPFQAFFKHERIQKPLKQGDPTTFNNNALEEINSFLEVLYTTPIHHPLQLRRQ